MATFSLIKIIKTSLDSYKHIHWPDIANFLFIFKMFHSGVSIYVEGFISKGNKIKQCDFCIISFNTQNRIIYSNSNKQFWKVFP